MDLMGPKNQHVEPNNGGLKDDIPFQRGVVKMIFLYSAAEGYRVNHPFIWMFPKIVVPPKHPF